MASLLLMVRFGLGEVSIEERGDLPELFRIGGEHGRERAPQLIERPLPPAPKQPYDSVKQPLDMCRPPFQGG